MASKLKITQVRSAIRQTSRQKRTLEALGLRRMHQTVLHNDTPQIRGMVEKVSHLVSMEVDAGSKSSRKKPADTVVAATASEVVQEVAEEKSEDKKAVKKPAAAKKTATKKTATKKTAAKKSSAKKSSAKKTSRTTGAKKTAQKSTAKKSAAKKASGGGKDSSGD